MSKTQILGHTISFSEENEKKLKNWRQTGFKTLIRLAIFYLVYLQLLDLWGFEATFILLIYFIGYGSLNELSEIKKEVKKWRKQK